MLWTVLLQAAFLMMTVATLVHLFTPYRLHPWRSYRLIAKIPGPTPLPFFGSVFQFMLNLEDILPTVGKVWQAYGPVFNLWMLGVANVFLTDPDDIEVIVNNKTHMNKSNIYRFLHPWFGTGLLTSTGSKWQARRRALTPTFHFRVLEDHVHVYNANSEVLVDTLRKRRGEVVDITRLMSLCTLDIICETAMGTSINALKGGQVEYIAAVNRMSQLFQHRYMTFWLYQDIVYNLTPSAREQRKALKILHSFTRKVIVARKAEYRAALSARGQQQAHEDQGWRQRLSFLDLLIAISEREGSLSDKDIQEEVDTFMFEGHHTVSAALSWTLFLLGHHQDVQARVHSELKEVFGDATRSATSADLARMRYTEQVIKEALRLYPSVPAISRHLTQDAVLKKYTIPAGVLVGILPYFVHRNPEIYPEPEVFDPERFSPAQAAGRHPFAYIPFSAGPRNCIGQRFAILEEKVVLSAILRNFTVTSLDRREDVKILSDMVLTPKDGLRMRFDLRDDVITS